MGSIKIDFVKDWEDEMIKEIKDEGIKIPKDMDIKTLILKYSTYLRKKGSRKPYIVHKSKEFECADNLEYGLNKIISILENSGDLSPYLSKQVDNLQNDPMFNDWGVLHLHLGNKPDKKDNNYVERTGPLLFLYFKENNAYLINIFEHGDWTKREILQIMYDNWPKLIEPFILEGVKGLSHSFSENDHFELRKSGGNAIIELKNNIIIISPALGIATSGDSIMDNINYNKEVRYLNNLQSMVKEKIGLIKDIIKKHSRPMPETFNFKLVKYNGNWAIEEQNTKLILEFLRYNKYKAPQ